MVTYLDEIVAYHRERAVLDRRSFHELEEAASARGPVRSFSGALRTASRRGEQVAVIAEIKRRSPSRGPLAPHLDPALLAEAYEKGGASCLSVLTDTPHFGGSTEDLVVARQASSLPVLRKDFTVAPADLYDVSAMEADAVLLIVAALTDEELTTFLALARDLSLDALVEVHDGDELARALGAGAVMIGVNQRDLRTFAVDPDRAAELVGAMPEEVLRVAESGIKDASDVARLIDASYDAILIGEALVTAEEPDVRLSELLGAERVKDR